MDTLIHQIEKTIVEKRDEIAGIRERIAGELRDLEVLEKEVDALDFDLHNLKMQSYSPERPSTGRKR